MTIGAWPHASSLCGTPGPGIFWPESMPGKPIFCSRFQDIVWVLLRKCGLQWKGRGWFCVVQLAMLRERVSENGARLRGTHKQLCAALKHCVPCAPEDQKRCVQNAFYPPPSPGTRHYSLRRKFSKKMKFFSGFFQGFSIFFKSFWKFQECLRHLFSIGGQRATWTSN